MLEAGLIISRFLHFAAATALFGASLYPLYTYQARAQARAEAQPTQLYRWLASILAVAAFAALVSNLLWLAFVTANMNDALSAAVNGMILRSLSYAATCWASSQPPVQLISAANVEQLGG